jgi:hypothetical protein
MVNFQFQKLKEIVNLKVVTVRSQESIHCFTRSAMLLTTIITSIRLQLEVKSVRNLTVGILDPSARAIV